MSNYRAIAAVTNSLCQLILPHEDVDMEEFDVTTKPPDLARTNMDSKNQLNIFLYQTAANAAWRNMDVPGQVKLGESGHAPLAMDLCYLITAYDKEDNDVNAHKILGYAMRVLHDYPLLSRNDIAETNSDSGLHRQFERVRITPLQLSLDEMSKLWTTFNTPYRISTAYKVSLVLIESTRPARTPLPVLKRGRNDEGPALRPDRQLQLTYPQLLTAIPEKQQPAARPGERLTLHGRNLAGDTVRARLTHPLLSEAIEVTPDAGSTAQQVNLLLPDDPSTVWVAGVYSLTLEIQRSGKTPRSSNALPLAIAPKIERISPNRPTPDPEGTVELTVEVSPPVRLEVDPPQPAQRVTLLFGEREIKPKPIDPPGSSLVFEIKDAVPGDYYLRLRVDGIDSLLIDRTQTPPVFDETQKVTIE